MNHIRTFESLDEKLELSANWETWAELWLERKTHLHAIGEEPPEEGEDRKDPGNEPEPRDDDGVEVVKTDREWIKEEIQEAKDEMKRLTNEYYQLWENLLATNLLPTWKAIVKQQCQTAPHIDKNGIRKEGKRGYSIPAHWFCRRAWMLKLCTPQCAEKHTHYVRTQIIKNPNIPCQEHVDRIIAMDELTPYLPCWKDEEGSPQELPRADVTSPGITLCMTVLDSLPLLLQQAYWAMKGAKHCPTDLHELKNDLALIEPQANQLAKTAKFVSQASKTKTGTSNASGKPAAMTSDKSRIPKKGKPTKTTESFKGKGSQKLCNKCVQWASHLKNTHNTRDCYRWNQDGTPMQKRQKNTGVTNNANSIVKEVKAKENRMAERLDRLDKNQEKMFKMFSKQSAKKRKHRRHRVLDDSSSSSESD